MSTVIQWLAKLQFQATHPLLATAKQRALQALVKSVVARTWRDTAELHQPVVPYPAAHPNAHMQVQRVLQLTILWRSIGSLVLYECSAYPTLLGGLIVTVRKKRAGDPQTREEVKTAKREIAEGVYCWLTSTVEPDVEAMHTKAYDQILKG